MKTIWMALVALAAASALPAMAQVTAEQAIGFLDKDRDGKCSLNEYLTFQVGKIAQFDVDEDGVLDKKEFKASLQGEGRKNADRSFDAFNTEQNRNALTQREFLGYHAYIFKQFVDRDNDGFMSAEEWAKIAGQGS